MKWGMIKSRRRLSIEHSNETSPLGRNVLCAKPLWMKKIAHGNALLACKYSMKQCLLMDCYYSTDGAKREYQSEKSREIAWGRFLREMWNSDGRRATAQLAPISFFAMGFEADGEQRVLPELNSYLWVVTHGHDTIPGISFHDGIELYSSGRLLPLQRYL